MLSSGKKGAELLEAIKAAGDDAPTGSALLREVLAGLSPEQAASLDWLNGKQYGGVIKNLLKGKSSEQKEAVFVVQAYCDSKGYPKVEGDPLIQSLFHAMFDKSLVDEDALLGWRDDDREVGNKRRALVQTTQFFTWLEEEEDEEEEEEDAGIEDLNNV